MSIALLLLAGLASGFVDSVIGGGGLISLPVLMLRLGFSPTAIGTNKVAGAFCTLTAMAIYGWKGHVRWKTAFRFAGWVGLGSLLGSAVGPRYLAPAYPVLLGLGTVLCLATLFFKNRLLSSPHPTLPSNSSSMGPCERSNTLRMVSPKGEGLSPIAAGLGLLCGFYDGAWGPGGGTFMFLALFYATPLGLMGSIAAAKIANFASSSLALAGYAAQGYLHLELGVIFGLSLAAGALTGARLALKHAEKILEPLILVISALLLWKLWNGLVVHLG